MTTNQKNDAKSFDENFDAIFGPSKKVKTGVFVYDKETGEIVPKGSLPTSGSSVNAPMIMAGMKAFVSPIDQTTISNREQLAAHNKKHGVTDSRDYNKGYIEKKAQAILEESQRDLKKTRREDLNRAFSDYS